MIVARISKGIFLTILLTLVIRHSCGAQFVEPDRPKNAHRGGFIPSTAPVTESSPAIPSSPADSNVSVIGFWKYGGCHANAIRGDTLLLGNGPHVQFFDISDPDSFRFLGEYDVSYLVKEILLSDSIAFVLDDRLASGTILKILDIRGIPHPTLISELEIPAGGARQIVRSGRYLYIVTGDVAIFIPRLVIVDIGDIHNPTIVQWFTGLGTKPLIQVKDSLFFTGWAFDATGISIYSISRPDTIVFLGEIETRYPTSCYAVDDTLLYILDGSMGTNRLSVFDISNPRLPTKLSEIETGGLFEEPRVMYYDSGKVYATSGSAMSSFDVTDPSSPWLIDSVMRLREYRECNHMLQRKGRFYMPCGSGMWMVQTSDSGRLTHAGFHPTGNDPFLLRRSDSTMIALSAGSGWIVGVLDISEPFHPEFLGGIELPAIDIRFAGDGSIAYAASEDDKYGFYVLDLTDRTHPLIIDTLLPGVRIWKMATSGHKVVGLARDSTVYVIDVGDPRKPVLMGSDRIPGRVRKIVAMDSLLVTIGHAPYGMKIFDMSDPNDIVLRSSMFEDVSDVALDGTIAYVCDLHAFYAVDLSNPSVPFLRDSMVTASAIGYSNVHLYGKTAYLTIADDTLYVIDISSVLRVVGVIAQAGPNDMEAYQDAIYLIVQGWGFAMLRNELLSRAEDPPNTPREIRLFQNYPNPFNPTTTLRIALRTATNVVLEVYDVLGRRVATLVDGYLTPGEHESVWETKGIPSGVYYARLTAGHHFETEKMILLK